MKVFSALSQNIAHVNETFSGCGDIVSRKFPVANGQIGIFVIYIDMLVNADVIDRTIMMPLIARAWNISSEPESRDIGVFEHLKNEGMTRADIREADDFGAIFTAIMSGDAAVFIDGSAKAVLVSSKGYPNRGVTTAETEVVVYGSKEAFSEVFRFNTALIRRRVRDANLKINQLKVGKRSQTDLALVYIKDVVRPQILNEVKSRISKINIDAVQDSGYIAQLIEDSRFSPFPQIQVTERPDKAASAVLEGRIVIVTDNSPFVLIVPATLGVFFQSSEDYYERWHIMSFLRLLRLAAAVISCVLPGAYIAAAVYHPSMISTPLILKMAEARQNIPLSAAFEVLVMDLAFELIREAGIRLPGAIGSTIGIVGGIILGQAAVEAGLVSPIVVIVVALTGIAAFTVPTSSFTSGIRLTKYFILIASCFLGMFGFWLACILVLAHLASLKSFGVPYTFPFSSPDLNGYTDIKDSVFRVPLFFMRKRPIFANKAQSVRMNMKDSRK
ncbi:MAG: spore germination protein [Clostridiales bacterium]|jgi:spore germination protein|nr:spore germination protein [Clostridiales bacterium]